MRFKTFLGDDEKTFQQLKIGLVKQKSDYDEVVRKVSEKHQLSNEIIELRNHLNEKLHNVYQGKFKFDFCLQEDINIDDLKTKRKGKLIDRLKTEVFGSNDKLAQSKTNMERKIKKEV
jgi:hypothetical protein